MAAISKLEYLKKYMDNGGSKEKKLKKKKKIQRHNNIKIIDSAISFQSIDAGMKSEEEGEFDLQEEKPILYAADGTTLMTEEYHEKERLKKSKWNPLASDISDINIKNHTNVRLPPPTKRCNSTNVSPVCQKKKLPHMPQRHDSSDSDLSPSREKRKSLPVRPQRHDSSDSDLSPVRERKKNLSPRGSRMGGSGDDMSPPRQSRVRHDTSDSDASPIRRIHDADEDLSPVRKRRNDHDDDLSPPRAIKNNSREHKVINSTSKRTESLPEVLSTGKSGLRTGDELREENELKRKNELAKMKTLDVVVLGKGAETIHRDRKTGKKIDMKLEAIKKRKLEEEKLEHEEKYAKWGKGVAQEDTYQQKLKEDLHEMEKPLARYKNDEDLDVLLREKDREGDPMLAFVKKSKEKQKGPTKPQYSGPNPAPNRFNIRPGYRYDGVDRSNGYEKRRFLEINKQKTFKDAAYKWSVEEM